MKNIHVLWTDKPSRLLKTIPKGNLFLAEKDSSGSNRENLHIYITNDERVKEGEWGYCPFFGGEVSILGKYFDFPNWKKIILTTNQDLIKDGIQEIDETFLEWYVKNPSCEEVEVEKQRICENCGVEDCNNFRCRGYDNVLRYEIVFPQEEPKQERVCNCGLKESEHNVRHPFVSIQETLKKVEENIDREEWINFFKNNSKEEILEYLIDYKFPL